MTMPSCPHCGSSVGYGLYVIAEVRVAANSGHEGGLEGDTFVFYDLDAGGSDLWDPKRVVSCPSESITCFACEEEITDKDFIQKVVDSINEGLSN